MAQQQSTGPGQKAATEEQLLRAQLVIEPHPDSNCAVVNEGKDAQSVSHDLKFDPAAGSGDCEGSCECHTEMSFEDPTEGSAYLKSGVHSKCICPVFENYDCIPKIEAVRDGAIVMVLTLPTREQLREILADLEAVEASVSVDWLVQGSDREATTEINVDEITDKQLEALELALDAGYYETPRQTDLGEIADELDISESAASQRLNAAETKLVKSFLEE